MILSDEENRSKINNETDLNIFVEAGAGSGKTHELVGRLVSMIKSGKKIEHICAITFTKAAAGEFYDRFYKELKEDDSDPLVREALKNFDLCFMGTIDAFCNMLINEYPYAAGIPAGSRIISDEELKQICIHELGNIAKGKYGAELQAKYFNFNKYVNNPSAEFGEILSPIISMRNFEIQYEKPVKNFSIDEYFSRQKRQLLDFISGIKLENVSDNLRGKPDKFIEMFNTIQDNLYVLKAKWDDNYPKLIKLLKKEVKDIRLNKAISPLLEEKPRLKAYVLNENFINSLVNDINNQVYSIKLDFVASAIELIAKNLKAKGKLTFFDYMLYTRDLLHDNPKLINHIQKKHKYFLIDEFQDTNPMQAEIFFYLSAIEPKSRWEDCDPRPGSMFIVGDPKQSIYRFRDADIASYAKVRSLFESKSNCEVVKLSNNFRSTAQMTKYFNDTFVSMLPKTDSEIQAEYEPIPINPDKVCSGFGGVYKYYTLKQRKAVDTIACESELICDIIEKLVSEHNVQYKDIMIITRRKGQILNYLPALRSRNIPVFSHGKIDFSNCKILMSTALIFRAIAYPNESHHIYSMLISEPFNCSRGDVVEYLNNGGKLKLEETNVSCKVADIINEVCEIKPASPAVLFDEIERKLALLKLTGSEDLDAYYYIKSKLQYLVADSSITSLQEASDYLMDVVKNISDIEISAGLEKETNKVKIANVHKVKGLQAPVVILANPSMPKRYSNIAKKDNKYWVSKISNYDGYSNEYLSTNMYEDKASYEEDCLDAEDVRLAYVAATRAKNALIVAELGSNAKSPWSDLIDDNTLYIFGMDQNYKPERRQVDDNTTELDYSVESKFNNSSSYNLVSPSDAEDHDYLPPVGGSEDAAELGTNVHRILETYVRSGFKITDDTYDIDYSDIKSMLSGAEEIYCEVPFSYKEDNNLVHGYIDLVYKTQGKWHIVDYKTGKTKDEHYDSQLDLYRLAFKKLTGFEADARIYRISI